MNQYLAKCWLFILNDSTTIGFTDHDVDLNIGEMVYHANSGHVKHLNQNIKDGPNHVELENIISHDLISIKDILSGVYDNANVEVFYVDIHALDNKKWARSGSIAEIKVDSDRVNIRVESLSSAFDQEICETYSENCRALLGDNRCKVQIEKYALKCKIDKILDKRRFLVNISQGDYKNYYSRGKAIFSAGANTIEIEILNMVGNEVVLANSISSGVKVNDDLTLMPGCNQTVAMCCQVYDNVLNFRGEPNIPNLGDIL